MIAVNEARVTSTKVPGSEHIVLLKRRLVISIGSLLFVVLGSTIGFQIIASPKTDWTSSLWKTLNIISTVGAMGSLTIPEQIWSIVVMVFGLGIAFYGFGNLTALLTSGEIFNIYEYRKMQRKLNTIKNHVILCGFGNTGQMIAKRLSNDHEPFVIIERNPEIAREARDQGWLVVVGDCTNEEILLQAGLSRAKILITVLDSDTENVFVVLTAKDLAPSIHIIARATLPTTVRKLQRAGAAYVTVPNEIAAIQMADLAVHPEIRSFITKALGRDEIELLEIPVSEHPWMHGKSIRDLNLTRTADVIVFSVIRNGKDAGQSFNPPPDTIVENDDTLLVVARSGARERLTALDN